MAGLGKGYERRLESEMNQNVCLPKKACLNKGLQTYSVNPFFYSQWSSLYLIVFSFFLVVLDQSHKDSSISTGETNPRHPEEEEGQRDEWGLKGFPQVRIESLSLRFRTRYELPYLTVSVLRTRSFFFVIAFRTVLWDRGALMPFLFRQKGSYIYQIWVVSPAFNKFRKEALFSSLGSKWDFFQIQRLASAKTSSLPSFRMHIKEDRLPLLTPCGERR